ncbi:Isoleucine--tRNA ligase [Candidatus Hepatincolaceae symbiont of Richtersius coronifer]
MDKDTKIAIEASIKASVRLPKTNFEMKTNLSKLGEEILVKWQEKNIYQKIRAKQKGKPKFILHDGPPYANGNLHVGHALNKILKDIVVRGYTLLGYDSPLVLGWDCHGLPIEWKIEEQYRKKGLKKEAIDILEFRSQCREFAQNWMEIQKAESKTLGLLADFENPYFTMNYKAESLIVKSIFDLLQKGVLYQGKRPILWSCVEKTALAEAEVEYKDKKSDTVFVTFQVHATPAGFTQWQDSYAVIWTTTPWTLPANQAIAYGSQISYGLYEILEIGEESLVKVETKLILAESLAEKIFAEIKVLQTKKIDSRLGLLDFNFKHCFYGLQANVGFKDNAELNYELQGISTPINLEDYNIIVPALEADFVDINTGTGLVHMAPAHGEEDFYLCKKNNIIPKQIVQEDGYYLGNLPLFGSKHIFQVADSIIEKLKENGSLVGWNKITHSYPHSWRSKAPLIYMLTSQWFISLNKLDTQKKATEVLNKVDFIPKTGQNRLQSTVQQRPDWCISRQRSWGVPLGIFINKLTKEPLIDVEVFNNIINAFAEQGADSWFNKDARDFLTTKYNKEDFEYTNDVADVWLDSGLTYKFVLQERAELAFPADLYLEGSDQHRGWFQSSLIMSILDSGGAPYKKILTHGFVLDEKGLKMSKSLGNVITPQEIIKNYGADILRIWVATCNYSEDIHIGKNILNQQAEIYRKIRNTLRYMLANLTSASQNLDYKTVVYKEIEDIDKWVLHNIYIMDELFTNTFTENFNFHIFFNKLFNFMQVELSAFYFDIKKDILYCDSEKSVKFKSTLHILDILCDFIMKWLAPFIPYTIEEAFAKRYNKDLGEFFLSDLIEVKKEWQNDMVFQQWEKIKKVRKVVTGCMEQARAKKDIGSSLEANPTVYVQDDYFNALKGIDFAEICITSGINIVKSTLEEDYKNKTDIFSLNDTPEVWVEFSKFQGHKCIRCWKLYKDLEKDLCNRCAKVFPIA